MQTQTFETSKGTLMAIRMEDGGKVLPDRIEGAYRSTSVYGEKIGRQKVFYFPKGFKEIGLWGSVSEEKAKEVVDNESVGLYVDYTAASDFGKKRRFDTALESLHSLIESEVQTVNPLGKRPECDCNDTCGEADRYNCGYDQHLWQAAEAQTWKNIFLMIKK